MNDSATQNSTTQIIDLEKAIAVSTDTGQQVIVIVPGWNDSGRTTRGLHSFLADHGLPVVTCSPQPTDGSRMISDLATDVEKTCSILVAKTKKPLKVVGFSMGGLILRSYLQEMEGYKHSTHLVTISTPHFGSLMAFFTNKPGLKEMRPNESWLSKLNSNRSMLTDMKITSIWSPFDTAIVPPASSYFPGAKNVRILSPAHNLILRDPRIHQAVLEGLEG